MDAKQTKIKILFLDIDFVINSHKFEIQEFASGRPFRPYYSEIDPKALAVVSDILNSDSAIQVVVHSSWRDELDVTQFRKIFGSFQFPSDRILGCTEPLIDKAKSIEIWLAQNTHVNRFVILDDDALFDLKHPFYSRFFRVPTRGLKPEDLSEILKKI